MTHSSILLPKPKAIVQILVLCQVVMLVEANHFVIESKLRQILFHDYDPFIRPNSTVTTQVRLSLFSINELNVQKQALSLVGWLTAEWHDCRLTWDPLQYGEIDVIHVTFYQIWKPEIIIDNALKRINMVMENSSMLLRVSHTGQVTWWLTGGFDTHCSVNILFYPFDAQDCPLEITTWAYTINQVELVPKDNTVDLRNYELNGQWDILATKIEKLQLSVNEEIHSQIHFHFSFRRRPEFCILTLLVPTVVTSVVCCLVFVLPSESGEKVQYSLTILLTYTVMLTIVSSYMPQTSRTISLISIYITIILFSGSLATLVTVVTLYFHHHFVDQPIPRMLRIVFENFLIPITRWKKRDLLEYRKMEQERKNREISLHVIDLRNRISQAAEGKSSNDSSSMSKRGFFKGYKIKRGKRKSLESIKKDGSAVDLVKLKKKRSSKNISRAGNEKKSETKAIKSTLSFDLHSGAFMNENPHNNRNSTHDNMANTSWNHRDSLIARETNVICQTSSPVDILDQTPTSDASSKLNLQFEADNKEMDNKDLNGGLDHEGQVQSQMVTRSSDGGDLQWTDLALILDAFFFRVMGLFVLTVTVAMFAVLVYKDRGLLYHHEGADLGHAQHIPGYY